MGAGYRYDNPDCSEARAGITDPGSSTFERAAARLDALDLLLERRRWAADRECDLVRSVTLYSDSSPVTGEELQGMVMDIMKHDNNAVLRCRAPACPTATLAPWPRL